MTTKVDSKRLSPEQLKEVFALIKRADSVELKLSIPESAQRSTLKALRIDPLDAQIRQVFFFDTPDLALNKRGVVVRGRRVQGKSSDTVVKLRPIDPASLPKDVRASAAFGVEVDAMPGGYVCSGSMKGVLDKDIVPDVAAGKIPIRKLLSREQRQFYEQHVADGPKLEDLSPLGPIFVLKLRMVPEELKRRFVVELWLYPDGSRILELSTKSLPAEALNTAMETLSFLDARGIDVSAEQQTKTKTALEFFSKELTAQHQDSKV
jgi:hypothetical protein